MYFTFRLNERAYGYHVWWLFMISQPGHMYILGQKKCGNSLRSLLEDFATVFVALYKCFNISYFFGQSSLTIYYILLCIECFLLSICQPSVISRDWDLPCKPSFHLRIINYININVTRSRSAQYSKFYVRYKWKDLE